MNESLKLTKGMPLKLTKAINYDKEATIGLGWDISRYTGSADFDLDLILFMCDENKRCISDEHFIWFRHLADKWGAIRHTGDNRTGIGDGDDESAKIVFSKVPADVKHIVIAVTMFNGKENGQNFGLVDNAYIRLLDDKDVEKAKYELSERNDTADKYSMIFAEFSRISDTEWQMIPVEKGYHKTLEELVTFYGLDLAYLVQKYCQ